MPGGRGNNLFYVRNHAPAPHIDPGSYRLQVGGEQRWRWRFWEAALDLPPGPQHLVVRAWDSAANTQPEDAARIWNFKGYMNTAWHSVRFEQLS